MYDLSRVNVPGKASLAEAAALSPTQRPWTAPACGPPTRLSRFRDRHPESPTSHLAPGCYGVELDRPDAPRPQAARWTDVTERFPEPAAAACVGSHSPGLPPHQTTQRFQDVPAMRSPVPRFAPYRGASTYYSGAAGKRRARQEWAPARWRCCSCGHVWDAGGATRHRGGACRGGFRHTGISHAFPSRVCLLLPPARTARRASTLQRVCPWLRPLAAPPCRSWRPRPAGYPCQPAPS